MSHRDPCAVADGWYLFFGPYENKRSVRCVRVVGDRLLDPDAGHDPLKPWVGKVADYIGDGKGKLVPVIDPRAALRDKARLEGLIATASAPCRNDPNGQWLHCTAQCMNEAARIIAKRSRGRK